MSHDLSHSRSQLLRFQMNPLSHIPLSINYLHSHLHLSPFHLCLLLQTLASTLNLHLQALCDSACLVLLVLDIRLNTLTWEYGFLMNKHNQKATDIFNKQDVTVYLIYIKILKD